MASKKPRNKAYKPRNLIIPKLFNVLSIRDEEPLLAMQIYGRIEGFLHDPTIEAGNHLCEILCQIAAGLHIISRGAGLRQSRDQYAVAVVSAIAALEDVSLRHRQYGDVTVRATEALTLRGVAGKLDEALGLIPVHVWNAACEDVKVATYKATHMRIEEERQLRAQGRVQIREIQREAA